MKNLDLLRIILKWKITLGVVAAGAIVLSAVFSSPFFIKPKYRSTAIIYPSNLNPYSQESPTEQMIQLFQSDSIFNHVVRHFNLVSHYGLDSASPTLRHQLMGIYGESVSIKKTEFEAVKIDVLDIDPNIACDMINQMINAFNINTLALNESKSKELVGVYYNQLQRKKLEIDSINIAMKELAVKYGIIDFKGQSRELSKEYYRTLATGNEKKISELTDAIRNLEERGGKYHELQEHLENSTKEYAAVLAQYNTALNDSYKNLTYTNVVVKPYPSDKKAYPVRWLIVTVAACSALIFSFIVILILEGRKQQN